MSGSILLHPPTQDELERMYYELAQHGAPAVGRERPWPYDPRGLEQLLALAGAMLRYDARLLSIVLELVLARWSSLNPLELRRQMVSMPQPQALLVVLEFAREASSDAELKHLLDYVSAGYRPVAPAQEFFVDAAVPGTRTHDRRRGRSLTAYSKWGFLGTERPTTSATRKTRVGRYDAPTRRRIRRELVARRGSFTMREYLAALDHGITRQRAYQDLQRDAEFELVGHGAGARWRQRSATEGRVRGGSRRRSG